MNFEFTFNANVYHHNIDLLDIRKTLEKIMSAISDFAAKVTAHQDAEDAAIAGLTADIKALNDEITTLQNSQGGISPADQASLDSIEARGQVIADKLAALDALTPPVAPPAP
jgi:hypothetical protein